MKNKLMIIFLVIANSLLATPKISGDLDLQQTELKTGNLADVITSILPTCDAALVIGIDGTAVFIPAYAFNQAQLENNDNIWNLKSDYLSPVTNIRNISEICLQKVPAKYSIQLINSEFSQISPFLYRLSDFTFLGESEKNGYTVRKYKLKAENNFWNTRQITKIVTTSGDSLNSRSANIKFKNFYFETENDTISKIIFQISKKN